MSITYSWFCQTHLSRLPFNSTKSISYISLGTSYDVDIVCVRKQLDIFLKNSAIAINYSLLQNTLHDDDEEVA